MAFIADDRRDVARDALDGLDRLLDAVPPDTAIPAREVGALVRLIRTALRDRASMVEQPRVD